MADILIRMEMPKHCFNCSTKIEPDNRRCNIDGHVFKETLTKLTCRRDENCPLHELPEHGDLIDRSELNNSFELSDFYGEPHDNVYSAICVVNSMPVIVPSNKEETK